MLLLDVLVGLLLGTASRVKADQCAVALGKLDENNASASGGKCCVVFLELFAALLAQGLVEFVFVRLASALSLLLLLVLASLGHALLL